MPGVYCTACGLVALLILQPLHTASSADPTQPPPDVEAFARHVREAIRLEYSQPQRFIYLEHRRDIDVSMLGKVSVGPLRTFEVYPSKPGDAWKRLIAVDGKPLDAAELARRDAEHERDKAKAESPKLRAAREKKDAEELRERDAILDDAARVYEFKFICRETLDGQPVVVFSLKPRPNARVTTREGSWMKQFTGRMWVSQDNYHLARVQLRATDHVSVGWGVVARVEPGSGFDYRRTRIGDAWAPAELTLEGSGRTLLFRKFQVKTVTTYTSHKPITN